WRQLSHCRAPDRAVAGKLHCTIRLQKPRRSAGVYRQHPLKSQAMSKTPSSKTGDGKAGSGSPLLRFFVKAGILFAGLGLCGVLLIGMALALAWPNLPDLHAMTDYRPRVPLRIYTADKVLI